ncbi:unnamed protein product [Lepeophtheirus salmonis]|uniref:(salmon louse) hypothetical protein n=1 Tax=Lepeophtheirus salmonis TaxID=72036 RepID=A0A7R8CEL4_LEPSM|nr:unnamed protein product [Lepeophtheirus salmonis]CAF2753818.1 unnamed protein product [Lepeophtheirus salmonis]
MVCSNKKGDIVGIQYQCGAIQDPSEPCEVDDDDDMDTMIDKEMKELEKDTTDSLSEVKKLDGGSNPRDVEYSDKLEDNMKRSKRDADDQNKHMFCYCDEDICNDSASLRGAAFLSGLFFTLVLIFIMFY